MPEKFPLSLTYDDVSLIPRVKSTIASRSIPSLKTRIKSATLDLPIISSPMDTVTNAEMAIAMENLGGVGIIHRFQSIEAQCTQLRKVMKYFDSHSHEQSNRDLDIAIPCRNVGAAVGVSGDWQRRLTTILREFYISRTTFDKDSRTKLWVNFDTANGFHEMVGKAILWLKNKSGLYSYTKDIIIVAGNVASREGYKYLAECGADVVRVGVSNGSPCKTGIVTSVGAGIISTILECHEERCASKKNPQDMPAIIADGGIRSSGDVAKALALGADAVMCGSLLAGFDQSEGDILFFDKETQETFHTPISKSNDQLIELKFLQEKCVKVKAYRGMASFDAAIKNNEINKTDKEIIPEGVSHYVPYKGDVIKFLTTFSGGIRSAMSYFNADNIAKFRQNADFCQLSYFSHIERTPFIEQNGL